MPADPQVKPLAKTATKADLMKAGRDQLKAYAKLGSECAKKAKVEINRRAKGGASMYQILAEEGEMTEELRNVYSLKALLS